MLLLESPVVFGRSASCGTVLAGDGVSRRHGRLTRDEQGRWWVEDLGSRNGTYLNGRPVSRHLLRHGDTICAGECRICFLDEAQPPGPLRESVLYLDDAPYDPRTFIERTPSAIGSLDAKRLAALYDVSKRLLGEKGMEGLLHATAVSLMSGLGAGVCVLGLTGDPERHPDQVKIWPERLRGGGLTLSRTLLRRAIDSGKAILVIDTSSDRALMEAESIVRGAIRSAVCIPIVRQNTVQGFIYVDSRETGRAYDEQDLEFVSAVGAMVGIAVENARLQEAELVKQRLEAELAAARRVQQAILPSSWPSVPGWEIAGFHEPCHEVGGDYYDALLTSDGRLWLIIADVCGKGAGAALLASSIHAAVHAIVAPSVSPIAVLEKLNEILLRRDHNGAFVTCQVAALDPRTGKLCLASAGHPHPIRLDDNSPPEILSTRGGFVLGALTDAVYQETNVSLSPEGGGLLFYTDGVSEALSQDRQLFGEERLLESVRDDPTRPAPEIIECLLTSIDRFRAGHPQSDDLTLLVCRRSRTQLP